MNQWLSIGDVSFKSFSWRWLIRRFRNFAAEREISVRHYGFRAFPERQMINVQHTQLKSDPFNRVEMRFSSSDASMARLASANARIFATIRSFTWMQKITCNTDLVCGCWPSPTNLNFKSISAFLTELFRRRNSKPLNTWFLETCVYNKRACSSLRWPLEIAALLLQAGLSGSRERLSGSPWPRGFISRRCLLKFTSDSGSVELLMDVFDIRRPCCPARAFTVMPSFRYKIVSIRYKFKLRIFIFLRIRSCGRRTHWQIRRLRAWMNGLCDVDLAIYKRHSLFGT